MKLSRCFAPVRALPVGAAALAAALLGCDDGVTVGPIGPTIVLAPTSATLRVGDSARVGALAIDASGARVRSAIGWESSDTTVAVALPRSDSTAVIIARRPGTAVVRVRRQDIPALRGEIPVLVQ